MRLPAGLRLGNVSVLTPPILASPHSENSHHFVIVSFPVSSPRCPMLVLSHSTISVIFGITGIPY